LQSNSVFTVAKGDRLDAPNLAFIITDGNANVDIATTAANAAAVRQQYTYVIVLSVGLDPNVYGLWTLASAPSSKTVYMASSFRDLTGLLDTRFINSFVGGRFFYFYASYHPVTAMLVKSSEYFVEGDAVTL